MVCTVVLKCVFKYEVVPFEPCFWKDLAQMMFGVWEIRKFNKPTHNLMIIVKFGKLIIITN